MRATHPGNIRVGVGAKLKLLNPHHAMPPRANCPYEAQIKILISVFKSVLNSLDYILGHLRCSH